MPPRQSRGAPAYAREPRQRELENEDDNTAIAMRTFKPLRFYISCRCGKLRLLRRKTPRERLICSDKTLSQLDDQIGRIYQERKAALSPHGAELLQHSEQSWLHYIAVVCPLESKLHNPSQRTPAQCLQGEYRQRLDALADVGKRIAPFIFNRIDMFSAQPFKDDTGANAGFSTKHVSYPQIDNSDSPAIEA
jgi:hypothetical protein